MEFILFKMAKVTRSHGRYGITAGAKYGIWHRQQPFDLLHKATTWNDHEIGRALRQFEFLTLLISGELAS